MVYFWYHDFCSAKFTLGQASRLHTSFPQNAEGKSDLYLSVSADPWAKRVLRVPLGSRQPPVMSLQHSVKRKKLSFPTHSPSLRQAAWHSSLSAEMGIQCRQCHIPWQMQQCGGKRERVTHFYPALVFRNQNRQQLPRLHHKDAKAELQVLTMVADESLHQKPSKILLLRHDCLFRVSKEELVRASSLCI